MKKHYHTTARLFVAVLALTIFSCSQPEKASTEATTTTTTEAAPLPDQASLSPEEVLKEGERLVMALDCNICHSAKKMTDKGPQLVEELKLAGYPANEKLPPYDAATLKNGWTLANPSFTAWVGPWGTSFAANITPDTATGIGNWKEEQFFKVMREGKFHGMEATRPLLPPMPWEAYRHLTDDELRAVFQYLLSVKPVRNAVPEPLPPTGAKPQ